MGHQCDFYDHSHPFDEDAQPGTNERNSDDDDKFNGEIFILDEGNVVMLFNGFQKKAQKTPEKEINKAIQLKKEYYAEKK